MSRAYQLILVSFTVLLLAVACRERGDSLARRSEDFKVVTEGQASGVTSTITAPGEAPAPLIQPPLTDTNLDTTTTFTIVNPAIGTTGTEAQGTLADTLPTEQERSRPRVSPRPAPRPTRPAEPAEPPIIDAPAREPEPEPEERREEPAPEQREEPEPEKPAEPPPPTTTNPS